MGFGRRNKKEEKPPEKKQPKPEETKETEEELKADAKAAEVSEHQQEEEKPEEVEEKTEESEEDQHEGLVRVKLLRSLYFPINGRPCEVSCSKDEIVRVSKAVYEEYKKDLEKMKPGPTTREMQEEKAKTGMSMKEATISSKDFGEKKE
jgi:hypothetical protein